MVHCFELALRPLLGNNFARNPSRKIPTRIPISVISTVVFVIAIPVFSVQSSVVSLVPTSLCPEPFVPPLHIRDPFLVANHVNLFLFLNRFPVL